MPKEFAEKIEKQGVEDVIVTADDILFAVPTKYLQEADINKIHKDSFKMLQWLKQHTTVLPRNKKKRKRREKKYE